MKILIFVFLAFALSVFVGPLAITLAKRLGAIDMPGSATHKKHNNPTPLAGGLVLFLVLSILIFFSDLKNESSLLALFAGSGIIFFFGMLDDIYGLSAPKKFLGQFFAATILAYSGTTYSEPHCQDHKLTKLRWINESGD